MGRGIAKVHQQAIAQMLRYLPTIAPDYCCAGLLVEAYYLTQLFRIELRRERGGIDQVTEHHGELPPLGLGRERSLGLWRFGPLMLRAACRLLARRARPHQNLAVFVHRQLLPLDELELQVFQRSVIE